MRHTSFVNYFTVFFLEVNCFAREKLSHVESSDAGVHRRKRILHLGGQLCVYDLPVCLLMQRRRLCKYLSCFGCRMKLIELNSIFMCDMGAY